MINLITKENYIGKNTSNCIVHYILKSFDGNIYYRCINSNYTGMYIIKYK